MAAVGGTGRRRFAGREWRLAPLAGSDRSLDDLRGWPYRSHNRLSEGK
jgi:hypothetical protein